jgi:hypothetical protein
MALPRCRGDDPDVVAGGHHGVDMGHQRVVVYPHAQTAGARARPVRGERDIGEGSAAHQTGDATTTVNLRIHIGPSPWRSLLDFR